MATRLRAVLFTTVALATLVTSQPAPTAATVAADPTVEVWANETTRMDGVFKEQAAPDQDLEIRWKGFTPNTRVVIAQCLTPIRAVNVYGAQSWNNGLPYCAHQTRLFGQTGADGTGKLVRPAKSAIFSSVTVSDNNQGTSPRASLQFECSAQNDSSCAIVVSECEWAQPLKLVKVTPASPWTLQPTPPSGVPDPAVAAASGFLRFKNGSDGQPARPVMPAPPLPRVEVKAPEPLPVPNNPVGAPVNGAGSVNISHVLTNWITSIRRQSEARDVSYIRGTSTFGAARLKQGFDSGFSSGADFAITGAAFPREEIGGDVAYAPISLTALALANGVEYGGLGLTGVKMSPEAFADLIAMANPTTGGDWAGTTFQGPTNADNRGCGLPLMAGRSVPRSGQSTQNQVISSWLGATLPAGRFGELFESQPGEMWLRIKRTGNTSSAENGGQSAEYIATLGGKGVQRVEEDGKIYQVSGPAKKQEGAVGFPDVTEMEAAREKGYVINASPVKNAAGQYVLPTKDAILEAFGTMTKNADGTYSPVFTRADKPGAYPLPMVHYLAVPKADTSGKNPLPADRRKTLAAFIEYAVGDPAQHTIDELGAPALPAALRDQAKQVAEMLKRPDPAGPSPTPSGTSSPTSSSSPTPTRRDDDQDESGGVVPVDVEVEVEPTPTVTVRVTRSPSQAPAKKAPAATSTPTKRPKEPAPALTPVGGSPSSLDVTPPTSAPPTQPPATPPTAELIAQPQNVQNEGSVRGGKIPAPAAVLPVGVVAAIGALSLLLGGGWRGYALVNRLRQRTKTEPADPADPAGPTGPGGAAESAGTGSGVAPSTDGTPHA
ncbi:substrate-binding domain-containing protein [Nonomuraea endophytica]|uniref:substrate-binding domain-containing protein n=1 Tax=Nonomuraea endophytica TaxID=714136 RepID=UPI0037C5E54A